MKIFIGSDHRGFEMKQHLVDWLKSQGHEVIDCGNEHLDPEDDYVDFAKKVASSVIPAKAGIYGDRSPIPTSPSFAGRGESGMTNHETSLGIVICGSGIGVSVVANRYDGIRCALGFNKEQVIHGRKNDHINMLSLAADYTDFEEAKFLVDAFLTTEPKEDEKYRRRIKKIDEMKRD